jgi:diguanylate cyclase (GGDEF)-like protein
MLKRKPESVQESIEPQIATDAATGLPDRSNLTPWLTQLAAQADKDSSRVALTFLELGEFGDITDTYGPDIGEKVLRTIAQRIANSLGDGQRICSYYGAELAVMTPKINSVERAHDITQSLLEVLGKPLKIGSAKVSMKTAAGVALSDSGYAGIADWLLDAHTALTEARLGGHGACVIHDESTRNRVDVRVTPARVLKGWEQSEFQLMYQPIVHAADGRIAGLEALLRWRDPGASGTFIGPNQFIEVLERTGLIVPVGAWVLREATGQLRGWTEMLPDRDPMFIMVNVGARQVAQKEFPDTVVKALDAVRLPPEQLVLDITEDALHFNKAGMWNALRDLKYLGIRISLDDFGVGEAGMSYLRDLQVDFVTIHRSFMQGVGHTDEDTAVIHALVELGRELGIGTVVEGVELDQQDEIMKSIGPDYIQGYYYGRPELAETTEELLRAGPTIEGSEAWKGLSDLGFADDGPVEEPAETE